MSAFEQAKQIVEEAEKLTAEKAAKLNFAQMGTLAWEYGFFKGAIQVKLFDAYKRIEELEQKLKQIEEE